MVKEGSKENSTGSCLVSSESSDIGTTSAYSSKKKTSNRTKNNLLHQRFEKDLFKRRRPKSNANHTQNYSWTPSHYVPHSFAHSMNKLGLENFLASQNSQRRRSIDGDVTRKSKELKPVHESGPKSSKPKKFLRAHARQAIDLFVRLTKRNVRNPKRAEERAQTNPPKRPIIKRSKAISVRRKNKQLSVQSLPRISYPMRLNNFEPEFVTTQDPWDATDQAKDRPQTAIGMNSNEARRRNSIGRRASRKSLPEPVSSILVPKNSIKSNHHHNHHHRRGSNATTATTTLASKVDCSVGSQGDGRSESVSELEPPKKISRPSQDQRRLSRGSTLGASSGGLRRHETQRLSLHHHPPLRLSLVSRNSASYPISFEAVKKFEESREKTDQRRFSTVSTRQSRNSSSNRSNELRLKRQSWAGGRPNTDSRSSKYSRSSLVSDKSLVISSHCTISDQRSSKRNSYVLPSVTDWTGVIEEDVTLTLMGCPRSSSVTPKKASKPRKSNKPSAQPSSIAPKISMEEPRPIPRIENPKRSSLLISTTGKAMRKTKEVEAFKPINDLRPLSLMFPRITKNGSLVQEDYCPSDNHGERKGDRYDEEKFKRENYGEGREEVEKDDDVECFKGPKLDWYSDLMSSIEQSISKI